jgi:hypothetical protein
MAAPALIFSIACVDSSFSALSRNIPTTLTASSGEYPEYPE